MKEKIILIFFFISIISFSEIGAKGALRDKNLDLKKMIIYALEDEYLAKNQYDLIGNKFSQANIFRTLRSAEKQHIILLLSLAKKYNIPVVDEREVIKSIKNIETYQEALEKSIINEMDNIAMYEMYIKKENSDDVRVAFQRLRTASEDHLAALKRQLKKVN